MEHGCDLGRAMLVAEAVTAVRITNFSGMGRLDVLKRMLNDTDLFKFDQDASDGFDARIKVTNFDRNSKVVVLLALWEILVCKELKWDKSDGWVEGHSSPARIIAWGSHSYTPAE